MDLGEDGKIPFEIRFAHDPKKDYGFVCTVYSSSLILFYKDHEKEKWTWKKVILLLFFSLNRNYKNLILNIIIKL
jgi:selenium-binding protein 1